MTTATRSSRQPRSSRPTKPARAVRLLQSPGCLLDGRLVIREGKVSTEYLFQYFAHDGQEMVVDMTKLALELVGWSQVHEVPVARYQVTLSGQGHACTCKHGVNRGQARQQCRHVGALLALVKQRRI